jgi:hypothetical protein
LRESLTKLINRCSIPILAFSFVDFNHPIPHFFCAIIAGKGDAHIVTPKTMKLTFERGMIQLPLVHIWTKIGRISWAVLR